MSVLVLGGAGYIGSHAVYRLLDAGYPVVVADNLSTGFREAVHPRAKFYQADICNQPELDAVFRSESIDGVIHFAAYSLVGESMKLPLKYYENNLWGTTVLLKSMRKNGVNNIVFSSTAAVYGEPVRVPIEETDPTAPTNCYGATKLAMEQMMGWTAEAHGLRYAALRYFNASGAHPSGGIGEAHCPETHLIPLILQVPLGRRESISIYGDDYSTRDGTCVRDYIHVMDLADAHILALEHLLRGGENDVFNLGNATGFTVKEVIRAARSVTGHPIPAQAAPRRAGDPAQLVASSDRIKSTLGWKPRYDSLEDIIQSAWTWHQRHPHGFGERRGTPETA